MHGRDDFARLIFIFIFIVPYTRCRAARVSARSPGAELFKHVLTTINGDIDALSSVTVLLARPAFSLAIPRTSSRRNTSLQCLITMLSQSCEYFSLELSTLVVSIRGRARLPLHQLAGVPVRASHRMQLAITNHAVATLPCVAVCRTGVVAATLGPRQTSDCTCRWFI